MRHAALIATFGSMVLATACNRSPEEDQARAAAAQRKADEQSEKAQREAEEKAAAAQNEANQKAANAQTSANETIRAANEDIGKARNDVREWANTKLNDADNDIDAARSKAQKANAAQRANFDRVMKDVQAKRDAFRSDIASIDTQPASGLQDLKGRLKKDADELTTVIGRLDDAL